MKRFLLATLLLAASAAAETVYFSATGKTFHKSDACMSLARTQTKLYAERKEAEAHNLKQCGICFRPAAKKKADNSAWAKEGK